MSDDLLQQAAAAVGGPPDMVMRSARARAQADGTTPEAVLARWAGVEVPAGEAAPAAQPAAPEAAPAAAPPAAAEPEVAVEVLGPEEEAEEPATEPEPVEEEEEPEEEPAEVLVGSAGISQSERFRIPRWIGAAFLVIPLFAFFYAVAFANGPSCGNSGSVGIDPATGLAANCDGGEFGSGASPLAAGAALYQVAAQPACSACHGEGGGGGAGPALAGGAVTVTFQSCTDHALWIALGTNAWRAEVGDTYGDTAKPVGGGGQMPGYTALLSPEEIAAVTLYERVQFGGVSEADALADCGYVDGQFVETEGGEEGMTAASE